MTLDSVYTSAAPKMTPMIMMTNDTAPLRLAGAEAAVLMADCGPGDWAAAATLAVRKSILRYSGHSFGRSANATLPGA
jgi:hypothetical protein